ncbi:glucose 1-dehydrogenase [Mycobacterium persicum]|uniref:D-arabitol-phosphate dehydrogenase n=1 Tax=Mycobacterium persicum TaxID=1487726 RepID=A0A1X0L896_9MYCO|nr:glucose 1-dehydrogenase [Mycobacterium persicum]KZS83674.1 theronine dehydrogenase [Mycobacterium persicum]ORB46830.1 theronine dehydrogenase [Mycobacterium persicum]ORB89579.1 theronine dehydrogenase [Mycobacterium persicum]ORB95022.1 theronine dehydrogenase [Mycobacterium persicum]ORC01770.1 theronine dehydrogenase [Mycobacterium persicum]
MQSLTIEPGRKGSMQVVDLPEPIAAAEELLVDGLALGVCGTDKELAAGDIGLPPSGSSWMVLGHESLGRVRQAPPGSSFSAGDLVVGVVRRPDPVPCGACARAEFDNCRNGRYTERGIKELHGYGSQTWCVEEKYAVRLDPALKHVGVLTEPTSVVVKAWEQIDRIGARGWFEPERVLVTGAGPIGLLAALTATQRGLETHVVDRVTSGPKPEAVRALGATYYHDDVESVAKKIRPDVVIEATGVGAVVVDAIRNTNFYAITCLLGLLSSGHHVDVDAGTLNRDIVLKNDVVVGSVNSNMRHFRGAADVLARADEAWLQRLITRRIPLARAGEAFEHREADIKVVIDLDEAG